MSLISTIRDAFSQEGNRTDVLRQTAYELKMSFLEKEEYGMIALLRDFQLFKKGNSKTIYNLLTQTTGLMEEKVNIFDYRYTISTGKSSRTYKQTVFFIQSKKLCMPEMMLEPENFFHKIGAWLGMQDIDFEENKQFSDQYLLQGEDEAHIRRTMGQEEVLRFFTLEKGWVLESLGFFMVLYKDDYLMQPHEIRHFYERGMMLYGQFTVDGER